MGGTKLLPALQKTVKTRSALEDNQCQIIVLTDGEVWNTEETIEYVRETRIQTGNNVRFFALGIGDAVSHRLVEGIGRGGGGFGEVVVLDSQGRWDERVIRMLKGAMAPSCWECEVNLPACDPNPAAERAGLVEQRQLLTEPSSSSPAASSVQAQDPDIRAPFRNENLHPFVRHSVFFLLKAPPGSFPRTIDIKIRTSSTQSKTLSLPIVAAKTRTTIIHHLAAKAAILDLHSGNSWFHAAFKSANKVRHDLDSEVSHEAEKLGVMYGITSKWTSFVAVDRKTTEENGTRSYEATRMDLELLTKSKTQGARDGP